MENDIFQHIASQLRKPEGEMGKQVGEKMNSSNKLINQWTIESLKVQPGEHILEIGMGNGAFIKDITCVDDSVKYTGVDFSATMIAEAERLNQHLVARKQAVFILGSAEALPFSAEVFDKVFTINTIYFWEDTSKVFNEIKWVLKKEGIMIMAVRPKDVMQEYPFTKYGFNMFSKAEIIELVVSNGFVVTDVVEREEPDQEINGRFVKTSSLIVVSRKEAKEQSRHV